MTTTPCSSSMNDRQTSVAFATVCTRCFSTDLAIAAHAGSAILHGGESCSVKKRSSVSPFRRTETGYVTASGPVGPPSKNTGGSGWQVCMRQ